MLFSGEGGIQCYGGDFNEDGVFDASDLEVVAHVNGGGDPSYCYPWASCGTYSWSEPPACEQACGRATCELRKNGRASPASDDECEGAAPARDCSATPECGGVAYEYLGAGVCVDSAGGRVNSALGGGRIRISADECKAHCGDWCQAYSTGGIPGHAAKNSCVLYFTEGGALPPEFDTDLWQLWDHLGFGEVTQVDPFPGYDCYKKLSAAPVAFGSGGTESTSSQGLFPVSLGAALVTSTVGLVVLCLALVALLGYLVAAKRRGGGNDAFWPGEVV